MHEQVCGLCCTRKDMPGHTVKGDPTDPLQERDFSQVLFLKHTHRTCLSAHAQDLPQRTCVQKVKRI